MDKKAEKILTKKKQDMKVMTWFAIVSGVVAVILMSVGIALKANKNPYGDGVLAFFGVFVFFCVMSVAITFYIKKEIFYIKNPEEKKKRDAELQKKYGRAEGRTQPKAKDAGLSYEEIDFLESDIYDE